MANTILHSVHGTSVPSTSSASTVFPCSPPLPSYLSGHRKFGSTRTLLPNVEGDILFEDFATILQQISLIPPVSVKSRIQANGNKHRNKTLALLKHLFKLLKPPSHPDLTQSSFSPTSSRLITQSQILFRLLFPHLDIKRKYDVQENRLGNLLAEALGLHVPRIPSSRYADTPKLSPSVTTSSMRSRHSRRKSFSSLTSSGPMEEIRKWNDPTCHSWLGGQRSEETCFSGCLGRVIEKLCLARYEGRRSTLTIAQVDTLLNELAASSRWSDQTIRDLFKSSDRRSASSIITLLFRDLSPFASNLITQIILKDITPALHPPPSRSLIGLLLEYDQTSRYLMDKWDVMSCWEEAIGIQERGMKSVWKMRTGFDSALDAIEEMLEKKGRIGIRTGIAIEIPKCSKSRSLKSSLQLFQKRKTPVIWAETKYDGERMQIHVNLSLPPGQQIKIISKSGRDSTQDRIHTHQHILAALSQPIPPSLPQNIHLSSRLSSPSSQLSRIVQQEIILDAEMVPYNERKGKIEEFWKISDCEGDRRRFFQKRRRLSPSIHSESFSASSSSRKPISNLGVQKHCAAMYDDSLQDEQEINSQEVIRGDLHLMLVFFDCLMVDGVSLVHRKYEERRRALESSIRVIDGFVMLAQRTMVDLTKSLDVAEKTLRQCFLEAVINREEGLVLKGEGTKYSYLPCWVKVKKDYIPGLQDTLDMVVLGASWDKQRGRELNVPPHVFTTFHVGLLDRAKDNNLSQPHYKILFPISYGLTRSQLEHWNNWIQTTANGSTTCYKLDSDDPQYSKGLSYSFDCVNIAARPRIIFKTPLVGEVFGAGYQKLTGSKYYEIRWPRLAKVYPPRDRYGSAGKILSDVVALDDYHRSALLQLGRSEPCHSLTKEGTQEESFDVDACFRSVINLSVSVESHRKTAVDQWDTKILEEDDGRYHEEVDEETMKFEAPEFYASEDDTEILELRSQDGVGLEFSGPMQREYSSVRCSLPTSSSSLPSAGTTQPIFCPTALKPSNTANSTGHLLFGTAQSESSHDLSPVPSGSACPSIGPRALNSPKGQDLPSNPSSLKRKKDHLYHIEDRNNFSSSIAVQLSSSLREPDRISGTSQCVIGSVMKALPRNLLFHTAFVSKSTSSSGFHVKLSKSTSTSTSTSPHINWPSPLASSDSICRHECNIPPTPTLISPSPSPLLLRSSPAINDFLPALPHGFTELLSVANVFVVPSHDVPLVFSVHIPRDDGRRWIDKPDMIPRASRMDPTPQPNLPSFLLGSNQQQTKTLEALLAHAGWPPSSVRSVLQSQSRPLQANSLASCSDGLLNPSAPLPKDPDKYVHLVKYKHGIIILNINLPSRGKKDLQHLRYALETRRETLQDSAGGKSLDRFGKIMVLDAGVLDPGFRRLKDQDWRKMLLWASWPQE